MAKLLRNLGQDHAEVSLLLVDDEGIREINRSYLQRDYPTNVIAFAMREGPHGELHPQVLGDIVISVETACRQGAEGALSMAESLSFLMIHGLLHLLGYDHEGGDPRELRRMEDKEDELFFLLHGFSLQRDL
ncbi:MAG: rRNA maturation RNase YbeY [Pseudomonadota bacterium]|nr:rRNA maturation RNase YbeY [Pseudomonadota bacterium]